MNVGLFIIGMVMQVVIMFIVIIVFMIGNYYVSCLLCSCWMDSVVVIVQLMVRMIVVIVFQIFFCVKFVNFFLMLRMFMVWFMICGRFRYDRLVIMMFIKLQVSSLIVVNWFIG